MIADPSHGTGRLSLIAPMTYAAIAAGADGIIIEVHRNPAEALSDTERHVRGGPVPLHGGHAGAGNHDVHRPPGGGHGGHDGDDIPHRVQYRL